MRNFGVFTLNFKNCQITKISATWISIVISLLLNLIVINFKLRAFSQTITDNTLVNESSLVTSNVEVRGKIADLIEGGARRDTNLFHSFLEFNVGELGRVYFANPIGVENIITRVTGNNRSEILGTLGVDGGANLFLINPNGIFFGENAQLDVAGSFVASTADGIKLGEDGLFSASDPQSSKLLNVQPGALFSHALRQHQGAIHSQGNLAVGENLILNGDNLDLQGQLYAGGNLILQAAKRVQIQDTIAQPFIASAGGNLVVQGNQGVDIFALNHPASGFFSGGNIVLRSASDVGGDAHYFAGGSFRIEKLDGSLGNLFSPDDPIIRSLGDVSFNNYTGASLHIVAGGQVNIGQITIISPAIGEAGTDFIREDITLSDGTVLSIDGQRQPTVDIRGGVDPMKVGIPGLTRNNAGFLQLANIPLLGTIPVPDNPTILPTPTNADINIGGIILLGENIPDGVIFLTNQYQPNTSLLSGNIKVGAILAAEEFSGFASLDVFRERLGINDPPENGDSLADALQNLPGNGGSIIIDSRENIIMTGEGISILIGEGLNEFDLDFGLIITFSNPGENSDITFIAGEEISLANSFIVSDHFGTGEGGDINFTARYISLTDTGVLTLITGLEQGKGGDININASESVNLLNGGGFGTNTAGAGNAGNVTLNTHQLIIQRDRDSLIPDTGITTVVGSRNSTGQGGNLIINADLVKVIGNKPGSFTPNLEESTIETLESLRTGIATTTAGEGDAGDLTINTRQLILQNGAGISTSPRLRENSISGNAGKLVINADEIDLLGKGGIATAGLGLGNANSLIINAGQIVLRDGATIGADTVNLGNAGNIEINTDQLRIFDVSRLGAATRGSGEGGNVIINASDSVEISGRSSNGQVPSGIFVDSEGIGQAGDLVINTRQLLVRDGAEISVNSIGVAGQAGSLEVNADFVILDNQGNLVAITTSGNGGDIILQVQELLLLRRNSNISTTAGTAEAGGDGGNIDIETKFLVAVPDEDSNITANAFTGNGGNIQIVVQDIFGIEFREQLTPESDITASSEFGVDGIVNINTPEVDSTQGVEKLPTDVVVDQPLQNCIAGVDNEISSFVITDRGGKQPNPREARAIDTVWEDLRLHSPSDNNFLGSRKVQLPTHSSSKPIVQAQGWVKLSDGTIILTAQTPTIIPDSPGYIPSICQGF